MFMDLSGWDRRKTVLLNIPLVTVLSLPAVFGYNILSFITPLGAGTAIMDLEDFLVSYNILPLGSLLFVLFCVKKNGWGYENFLKEADEGRGMRFPAKLKWYMTYVIPLLIVIIYLKGYYDLFREKGPAMLAVWMCVAFAFLALILRFSCSKKERSAAKSSR
jgi:NSS family neurotransmitter:Na+ symporter